MMYGLGAQLVPGEGTASGATVISSKPPLPPAPPPSPPPTITPSWSLVPVKPPPAVPSGNVPSGGGAGPDSFPIHNDVTPYQPWAGQFGTGQKSVSPAVGPSHNDITFELEPAPVQSGLTVVLLALAGWLLWPRKRR